MQRRTLKLKLSPFNTRELTFYGESKADTALLTSAVCKGEHWFEFRTNACPEGNALVFALFDEARVLPAVFVAEALTMLGCTYYVLAAHRISSMDHEARHAAHTARQDRHTRTVGQREGGEMDALPGGAAHAQDRGARLGAEGAGAVGHGALHISKHVLKAVPRCLEIPLNYDDERYSCLDADVPRYIRKYSRVD